MNPHVRALQKPDPVISGWDIGNHTEHAASSSHWEKSDTSDTSYHHC